MVENGPRPLRAGIKGRFYLSISAENSRGSELSRDFAAFKNPTLPPRFLFLSISLIFRVVGKEE